MAENNNTIERELNWDDTIEKDSEFSLLPTGDYTFTVVGFERQRHNGSDKLPPCNKAVITLDVTNGTRSGRLTHNLFLHTRTEGMLCEFFTAIGQRQHGDKLNMNWGTVAGSTGRCKISTRTYNGNEYNDIKRFYEPKEPNTAAAAPSYQAGAF